MSIDRKNGTLIIIGNPMALGRVPVLNQKTKTSTAAVVAAEPRSVHCHSCINVLDALPGWAVAVSSRRVILIMSRPPPCLQAINRNDGERPSFIKLLHNRNFIRLVYTAPNGRTGPSGHEINIY